MWAPLICIRQARTNTWIGNEVLNLGPPTSSLRKIFKYQEESYYEIALSLLIFHLSLIIIQVGGSVLVFINEKITREVTYFDQIIQNHKALSLTNSGIWFIINIFTSPGYFWCTSSLNISLKCCLDYLGGLLYKGNDIMQWKFPEHSIMPQK